MNGQCERGLIVSVFDVFGFEFDDVGVPGALFAIHPEQSHLQGTVPATKWLSVRHATPLVDILRAARVLLE